MECYRSLILNPESVNDVDPDLKKQLDLAIVCLVNKFVVPQLATLGFVKKSFQTDGINEENGRLFNRVVYVQKE